MATKPSATRSAINHRIVSMVPHNAIYYLIGEIEVLLAPEDLESDGQRIILHSTSPQNDQDKNEMVQTFAELSMSTGVEVSLPEECVVGYLKLGKSFKYDAVQFAIDHEKHGTGHDLTKVLNDSGWLEVWGHPIEEAFMLFNPIHGIGYELNEDKGAGHLQYWWPDTPMAQMASKMVLDPETKGILTTLS